MTECDGSRSVFNGPYRTVGEAWIQLKKSLHDEAEVHLKFSNKVKTCHSPVHPPPEVRSPNQITLVLEKAKACL